MFCPTVTTRYELKVVRLDTTGEKGSGLGEAYVYDVKELGRIDPNLILYEESGEPISTGLEGARAIAVGNDGRIYVGGDKAIRMFSPSGSFVHNKVDARFEFEDG